MSKRNREVNEEQIIYIERVTSYGAGVERIYNVTARHLPSGHEASVVYRGSLTTARSKAREALGEILDAKWLS
jgi:effector-binding domain-containing protein